MNNFLVLCDQADVPNSWDTTQYNLLNINQHQRHRNLRIKIENLTHSLLKQLDSLSRDLIDIASYIYYADSSIRRGTEKDVFISDWRRNFNFVIPVRRLDIWEKQSVQTALIETLEYLTEDKFQFSFVERKQSAEQLVLEDIANTLPFGPGADCILLFSGGLDSLAGAVDLKSQGRHPILASHQSRSVMAAQQRRLAELLRNKFADWVFPHIDININRIGNIAVENTQRSRSFLFLTLGTIIAFEVGLSEIIVAENGVTTFNLPRIGQPVSTQASRSTHPFIIASFRRLISDIYNTDFKIVTPFLWKTRAEVINILKQGSSLDLLPITTSCNHARRPKIYPHCGTCSQCVDRRFAVIYAEIGDAISQEQMGYEKDIFTQPLDDPIQRMQAISPINFQLDLMKRDINEFIEKYGQVYDALDYIEGDSEKNLTNIFNLHRRYANEIDQVMKKMVGNAWGRRYLGELPDNCLINLVNQESTILPDNNLRETANDFIKRLSALPFSVIKPFEDLCKDILVFLFTEGVPESMALTNPKEQAPNDQRTKKRDLIFENHATKGFWAEVRQTYNSVGVIFDAKNHKDPIDGPIVLEFSSKYLQDYKLGKFGVIVARKIPEEARMIVGPNDNVPSAIDEQKNQWRDHQKMIILIDDNDVLDMLNLKATGQDPTKLLRDRIYLLRERM